MKFNLVNIIPEDVRMKASSLASKAVLTARKVAPDALLVIGIGAIVVGTVELCKATKVAEPIVDNARNDINDLKEDLKAELIDPKQYSEKRKEITIEMAGKLVKTYGPGVVTLMGGIGCVTKGHMMIKGRYLAVSDAYASLSSAFNNYRQNVIADGGENGHELDMKYMYGLKEDKDHPDEEAYLVDTEEVSEYTFFFDSISRYYSKDPFLNKSTLVNSQRAMQMKLDIQEHLFVNEVLKDLDLPLVPWGQYIGWTKGDKVDYGLLDGSKQTVRDFMNGVEPVFMITLNPSGNILNTLGLSTR